jgi:Ca2+-binding EF-hand superfamily protein
MYKQFKKETPSETITQEDFREFLKGMGVTDSFLQDLLFGVFDKNKDGQINFHEFVTALSVITRGDANEKLECTRTPY